MTIFVDDCRYRVKSLAPQARVSHMWSSGDLAELHAMAEKLGIAHRRLYTAQKSKRKSYYITRRERVRAIRLGAIAI